MKKLIITGASSGIGCRLASCFSGSYKVWSCSRAEHPELPGSFKFTPHVNIANWDSIRRFSRKVKQEWNGIDALICCAGLQGPIGPAMKADVTQWSETVRTNLDGMFYTIKAFHNLLMHGRVRIPSISRPSTQQSRAKVICLAGGGAGYSRPHFSAYAASKTAVVRLVETLADEWKGQHIDINALAPGAFPSRMTQQIIEAGRDVVGGHAYTDALHVGVGLGIKEHLLLTTVAFLLSNESAGVSGKFISAQQNDVKEPDIAKPNLYVLRRVTEIDLH